MFVSHWIFTDMWERGYDAYLNGDVSFYGPLSAGARENLIKLDNATYWRAGNQPEPISLVIKLNNPVTFALYKLQLPEGFRFPTGWRVEGSMNNIDYELLSDIEDNFCSVVIEYTDGSNCGELTTRFFSSSIGVYKYIRLSMTKPDSFGTYYFGFSFFDIFGIFTTSHSHCSNNIQISFIFLQLSFSFISS